jgi:hypothetical protein
MQILRGEPFYLPENEVLPARWAIRDRQGTQLAAYRITALAPVHNNTLTLAAQNRDEVQIVETDDFSRIIGISIVGRTFADLPVQGSSIGFVRE